eukprot:3159035-Rhodomonas_salina.1
MLPFFLSAKRKPQNRMHIGSHRYPGYDDQPTRYCRFPEYKQVHWSARPSVINGIFTGSTIR